MSVTVSGGAIQTLAWVRSLGPSRSHPGSEVVPSRFAMCFVLQCFGPIQVPRWGPSRPVLVPSCSRAFLTGSGLDGQKQTSWPLPRFARICRFADSRESGHLRCRNLWLKKSLTPTSFCSREVQTNFRSHPGKPNQRKASS